MSKIEGTPTFFSDKISHIWYVPWSFYSPTCCLWTIRFVLFFESRVARFLSIYLLQIERRSVIKHIEVGMPNSHTPKDNQLQIQRQLYLSSSLIREHLRNPLSLTFPKGKHTELLIGPSWVHEGTILSCAPSELLWGSIDLPKELSYDAHSMNYSELVDPRRNHSCPQ